MKRTVLIAGVFIAIASAHAEERPQWSEHIFVGSTLGNSMDATVKDSDGSTITSGSSTGKRAVAVAAEVTRRMEGGPIAITGSLGWTRYLYEGQNKPNTEISLFIIPKVIKQSARWDIWAGIGFGIINSSFGTTTFSDATYTLTTEGSSMGFAFSPRVGVDYNWPNGFSFGVEAGYTNYSYSVAETIVGGSITTPARLTEDITQTRWFFGVRVGFDAF